MKGRRNDTKNRTVTLGIKVAEKFDKRNRIRHKVDDEVT